MGTGSFPGVEFGRGVTLTPYPLLVPRSETSRAISILSLRAFVDCEKGEIYLESLGLIITWTVTIVLNLTIFLPLYLNANRVLSAIAFDLNVTQQARNSSLMMAQT
jgi:hypothetical protein